MLALFGDSNAGLGDRNPVLELTHLREALSQPTATDHRDDSGGAKPLMFEALVFHNRESPIEHRDRLLVLPRMMEGYPHVIMGHGIQFHIVSVNSQSARPGLDGAVMIADDPVIANQKIEHSSQPFMIAYSLGDRFGFSQASVEFFKLAENKNRVAKFQSNIHGAPQRVTVLRQVL